MLASELSNKKDEYAHLELLYERDCCEKYHAIKL